MRDLLSPARAYLAAAGFKPRREDPGFLDMEREGRNGAPSERLLVWGDGGVRTSSGLRALVQSGRENNERQLLESFAQEMRAAPDATGFYIVETRQGLTQQFVSDATRLLGKKGGIRSPIEFFDVPYRINGGEPQSARSVLTDLLEKSETLARVDQPFFVRRSVAPDDRALCSGDLVAFLEVEIRDTEERPKLRIIEGGAGSGKTMTFNALVASLYRGFNEAKREDRAYRRPVVFLPAHLREGRVGNVNDLIAAVNETDMVVAAAPEQFTWLLVNGYSIWMFDALDEFYDGSPDLFTFIEEVLSAPGSKAQFIISTRDSLVSSNPVLRGFLERHLAKGSDVEVYDLAPWTADAWREMARRELAAHGANGSVEVRADEFVSSIEKSKEMTALAGLPFYCSLLAERFRKDGALPRDEFEVLEFLVERMVDREHGKEDIFRWGDYVDLEVLSRLIEQEMARRGLSSPEGFSPQSVVSELMNAEGRDILLEVIGSIAHEQRRMATGAIGWQSIQTDDLRQLSALANVSISHNSEIVRRLQTAVVQFAFFGPGKKANSVDFTHQIAADYLAARYAAIVMKRELLDGHDAVGSDLSQDAAALTRAMKKAVGTIELVPHSLFCRALTREINKDAALERLFASLRDAGNSAARQI